MKKRATFLILLITLAACSSESNPPTHTPAPTSSPTAPVSLPMSLFEIEENYETLRQLHVEISGIWESLARGENVQCGTEFEIPTPGSFSSEMGQQLATIAAELRAASNRWVAECANPRADVPQEIIEAGLLEVRAAGDALREVESFLAESP